MPREWQPDPEYVEFLRDAQETVNANNDFEREYGFPHECHCAEDYEEGNVGLVADCWAGMANDAMQTCKRLLSELDIAKLAIGQLQAQVAGLGAKPVV